MKLEDIILALEMTSDSSQAFYDLVTKEITWLDDFGMTREEYEAASETLDAHGFKRLPDLWDINEYGMMEDFAQECESRDLLIAIKGRGAFRRFKDAVHSLGLAQDWYHFRDAQYIRIALEWCRECGIELNCDAPKV